MAMHESADDTPQSEDKFAGLDTRSPEVRRLDYMADLVVKLTESVQKVIEHAPHQTKQHVTYKVEGMGAVGVVCAVVCICCVLMMLGSGWLIAIEFGKQNAELHDLRAWR